jgi:two-component system nitrogen regulation sensor histidine kinase NtrY
MNFRRKLLAVFALTVFLSVVAVTWIVSSITRRAFEQLNEERTTAIVAQFRREFNRRGDEVLRRVQALAANDAISRIALAVNRGPGDYSEFVGDARNLAAAQQLDFLEFVLADGTIISSAQWPAKFGYKDSRVSLPQGQKGAFLRQEELPEGGALALEAEQEIRLGDSPLYVIGGMRLDKDFLASLELPAGMRAMLYQNIGVPFSHRLVDASGDVQNAEALEPLVNDVKRLNGEATDVIHWSSDPVSDEQVHAMPLYSPDRQLLAVLLVGSSRRPYAEMVQRIRSAALLVGTIGIVLAVLFSGWAAARVTRPVERLAEAAREVGAGNWGAQVPVTSRDEIGELTEAFNRMTQEMLQQRQQLVQSERVAAWRELARRLAHELKNPLFPLQITVENLIRAREQAPEQFDEVFKESSATLLAEIANLKTIVSRFSEFSRMPQPHFQSVNLNQIVENVVRLFQAQFQSAQGAIACKLDLAQPIHTIAGDPEMLHRAVSNLVLNAMDAMPEGGTVTLTTSREKDLTVLTISDTGTGLTPAERDRLFTPYYTSKTHGTGLGLAIVQSVMSDHGGRISVQSQPGHGSTFKMELPFNLDKLRGPGSSSTTV